MARKGRQFELLVTRIQRVLAPEGAKVTSPDWIVDAITGQRREVDAAIRYRRDGKDILINVECRDRNSAQDTTWIEQLVTKRRDINASHTIAVSKSRFSAQAVTKAQAYGIDVYTIQDIQDTEISTWIRPFRVTVLENKWDVLGVNIAIFEEPGDDLEAMMEALKAVPMQRVRFHENETGQELGVEDVVRRWQHTHRDVDGDIFASVKQDEVKYEKKIRYIMVPNQLSFAIGKLRRDLRELEIIVVVWRELSFVDRARRISYAGPEKPVVQAAEYDLPQIDKDFVLSLHRNLESGQTRVSWSWDRPNRPGGRKVR